MTLPNKSNFETSHVMFDPNDIVGEFMSSHPKFNEKYIYNGLWRGENDGYCTLLFQQKIKWSQIAKMAANK